MRYLQSPDPFYPTVVFVGLGGFFLVFPHTFICFFFSNYPSKPGFCLFALSSTLAPALFSAVCSRWLHWTIILQKKKCYFLFLIFSITSHLSPQSSQLSYPVRLKTLAPSLGICFLFLFPLCTIIDNLPLVHLFSSLSVHFLTVQTIEWLSSMHPFHVMALFVFV